MNVTKLSVFSLMGIIEKQIASQTKDAFVVVTDKSTGKVFELAIAYINMDGDKLTGFANPPAGDVNDKMTKPLRALMAFFHAPLDASSNPTQDWTIQYGRKARLLLIREKPVDGVITQNWALRFTSLLGRGNKIKKANLKIFLDESPKAPYIPVGQSIPCYEIRGNKASGHLVRQIESYRVHPSGSVTILKLMI